MITLNKSKGADFRILNFSDIQLSDSEWEQGEDGGNIFKGTADLLIDEVKPDLITLSGDQSWAGNMKAYKHVADYFESKGIPWAPVWGNHDNQGGAEFIDALADSYLQYSLCVYEKGDLSMGNGNYVIRVVEEGRPIFAAIMMDTHDRAPYTDADGKTSDAWAKLIPSQVEWYKENVAALKGEGINSVAVITHIPIYAYRDAFAAAYNGEKEPKYVTIAESESGSCWNAGYESSTGVCHEGIASYPEDEGMFEAVLASGIQTVLLAGHDHINNFIINYKGADFVYSLKAGCGCYWDKELNGGTVIAVGSDGKYKIEHKYVNPAPFTSKQ